jgi:hypothetical protein
MTGVSLRADNNIRFLAQGPSVARAGPYGERESRKKNQGKMPIISERARRATAPACLRTRAGNLNGFELMSRLETSNLTNNALPILAAPVSKKIHNTRTAAVSR